MIKEIAEKIKSGEVPVQYRDPQEFMFGESRTAESDVYSFGMYIFGQISGQDYFKYAGIPEDECFMMADPDSEKSVIDEKFIPENFGYLAELLKRMTVYRKELRISSGEALRMLEKFAETEMNETEPADTAEEKRSAEEYSQEKPEAVPESEIADACHEATSVYAEKYTVKPDYDYGIILNNRRSGRIEFRPLLFHDGRTEAYTVPVEKQGEFVIAVSERHRDYAHISNPSSVYGDSILPVGLCSAENVNSARLSISAENESGVLKINFDEISVAGEKTGKRYDVKRG